MITEIDNVYVDNFSFLEEVEEKDKSQALTTLINGGQDNGRNTDQEK